MPDEIIIKKPEYTGLFYPSDCREFKDQLDILLSKVATLGPDLSEVPLRALIVPSAGFSYSAQTALAAYHKIQARKYSKILVLGSSHFFSFQGIALSSAQAFETIFGQIELDLPSIRKLQNNFNFHVYDSAFSKEYSIELQLPYLQHFQKDFKLIPMLVGSKVNLQECAKVISEILDESTLLIVSTNLSHFLDEENARIADQLTINALQSKSTVQIMKEGHASAIHALALLNEIAISNHWLPVYLDYSNSTRGGDDADSVVGYTGMIYLQE
jgi:AmmeMemoRadiSam system protein B